MMTWYYSESNWLCYLKTYYVNTGLQGAASKPAGSFNKQSGKQEGLSNTDTKHSTDIANDPEKSKKSTGGPDTAKEKGTVDSRAS